MTLASMRNSRRRWFFIILAFLVLSLGGLAWYLLSADAPGLPSREPLPREEVGVRALPPRHGLYRISTTPAGATIEVDARAVDQRTPAQLRLVAKVSHRIRLLKEGRKPVSLTVRLAPGEVREQHMALPMDEGLDEPISVQK